MHAEGSETAATDVERPDAAAWWRPADWIVLAALVAATAAAFVLLVQGDGGALARRALAAHRDRYFQADCPEMLEDMVDLQGRHGRGGLVHPVFCGLTLPPTNLLIRGAGFGRLQAAWVVQATAALLGVALLYVAARAAGVPRLGAALAVALAPASAAALFWWPLPETYALGSMAIAAGLATAAVATRRRIPTPVHLAAGVLGLGVTITNWMVSLATLAVFEPRRRAVALALATLAIVYAVWSVEAVSLPQPPATPMSPREVKRYSSRFIFHPDAGGPIPILRAEWITPILAPPPIAIDPVDSDPPQAMVSFQKSSIFRGGPLAVAATVAWLSALALGLYGLAAGPVDPRFRLVLGAVLAGQVVLHLLHGEETFLYSLHFLPVLLLTAAMGTTTRFGRASEALLALTIVLALANNLGRLREVVEFPLPPPPPASTMDSSFR